MATATKRKKAAAPRRSYQLRDGFRAKIEGAVIGGSIEALKAKHPRGEVTPAAVVDVARPAEAPLHPCFEWDDPRAAELYRQDQARYLIRCYEVRVEEQDLAPVIYIANVCIVSNEEERVYVSTDVAMRDEDMRAQVIAEAERLLAGVFSRYRGIPGLRDLMQEAIERVVDS